MLGVRALAGIVAICALIGFASCCPFADLGLVDLDYNDCIVHHSKEMCEHMNFQKGESRSLRKLLGAPGYPPLPEPDISLKNNGLLSPQLSTAVFHAYDLIDYIAGYVGGLLPGINPPAELLGKDMCLWNFQSLPPPPGPDNQYRIPPLDAARAIELCDIANERFQKEIGKDKNNGVVVFGGCTIGARGSHDLCEYNLDDDYNSRYCGNPTQSSSVRWPQAVTMFKVRAATSIENKENAVLKAFIAKWRSSDKLHKSHIRWVMEGGTGSAAGSVVGGWGSGSGPGINRKIIPCDAIDPKYIYPTKAFAADALNAAVRARPANGPARAPTT